MILLNGDCLEQLKTLESNSVDSLVTDPPAGISFMGKGWDSDKGGRDSWIKWMAEVMAECHRVLKPGAHGLVWALPRTSHWTATACEDAGFEIRDIVHHLFGSGFPKSLDISKAIDKAAGVERQVVGEKSNKGRGSAIHGGGLNAESEFDPITAPATDSAKQWQGWGTALKPAAENWILIRKPCSEKTVAANVQKYGTGGINIDAGRIEAADVQEGRLRHGGGNPSVYGKYDQSVKPASPAGRFPANLVFSHSPYCSDDQCDIECAIAALDAQSGTLKSGKLNRESIKAPNKTYGKAPALTGIYEATEGGASRFFYCAKISSSERNAAGPNGHPTVKAKKLMAYLIKLITPQGGVVLDPFMGSGSTGLAAKEQGFQFIGIERESEYFEIAKARVNA